MHDEENIFASLVKSALNIYYFPLGEHFFRILSIILKILTHFVVQILVTFFLLQCPISGSYRGTKTHEEWKKFVGKEGPP